MPRTRQIISGAAQGRWQDALREAERQLRSQAGGSPVSQQAIWNRAIQIGGRPPGPARPAQREIVVAGQRPREGGATTGNVPAPLQDLIDEFQRAEDEANAANEARYQDVLGRFGDLITQQGEGYRERERQFQDTIAGYGAGQEARINRQFDRLGASAQAGLVGRGLTASTVLPSVRRGVEDERNMALLDLGDRLAGLRLSGQSQLSGDTLGALGSLTQNQLGFMERRTDQGPDFGQLIALSQLYGQGNQGQGFNIPLPQGGGPSGRPVLGTPAPIFSPGGFQVSDLGSQLVAGAQGAAFQGALPGLLYQMLAGQRAGGGTAPVNPAQPSSPFANPNWFAAGVADRGHGGAPVGAPVGTPQFRFRNAYSNVYGRNPWAGGIMNRSH